MNINYFENRDVIAKNLIQLMRDRGFSKLSFSKVTDISRPTLDLVLKGESPSPKQYNTQILKIIEKFELLPDELLLVNEALPRPYQHSYAFSDHGTDAERSPTTKELLDGLDNVLDVFALYLK